MHRARVAVVVIGLAMLVWHSPRHIAGQGWVKGTYLSDANVGCPPFVFVALPTTKNRLGADVEEADLQDSDHLGDPGRTLMFMKRELTEPVQIFPRTKDLKPTGALPQGTIFANGAVHEPTIYHDRAHDRYWAIFAFAEDLVSRTMTKPCEIYAMDVTDALGSATTLDPASLPPAVQLTDSPKMSSQVWAEAFNGAWASTMWWSAGFSAHFTTNHGPCVVDEEHGPVLYFASNLRRAGGFGMMAGDLEFTATGVTLKNKREVQHFGTTSLLSFFETPKGCGGSYQSSTESIGQWGIFEFESDEGFWNTASGYFNPTNISDHLGTTIAKGTDPNESLLAVTRYYIGNNRGFGGIMIIPYADIGFNVVTSTNVTQAGLLRLFPGIAEEEDQTSDLGKFSMPAAGRNLGTNAVELFLTYSPEKSHGSALGDYHATLVAVTDVSQGIHPRPGHILPSTYDQPAYDDTVADFHTVLRHPNIHAFAMRPILTHAERFGWNYREVKPLHRPDPSWIPSQLEDMPVARVTAGPIYRTDLESYRQRHGSYDPSTEPRNGNADEFVVRIATLTKDIPDVSPSDVWGLRIFITDPRVQRHYPPDRKLEPKSDWGYLHHNGDGAPGLYTDAIELERYRHLSDVKAEVDGTVSFLLPSNMPVKFFLIHKDGTVLAQHRAHHSFATGQHDNRCTGCHQHDITKRGFDSTGLTAWQPSYVPFDTLTQTLKITGWDSQGNLTLTTLATPTAPVPEFKQDIFPILTANCASCHDSTTDPLGVGIAKLDLSMSPLESGEDVKTSVWRELHDKRWVNRRLGAAMSPLAWIAAGVASDTATRLDGETNSRYLPADVTGSAHWVTTRFTGSGGLTACHDGIPAADAYKIIEWIDAGAGIDHNHQSGPPSNPTTINGGGLNYDGYQIALSMRCEVGYGSTANTLTVGFWDVDQNVDRLVVTFGNHTPITRYVGLNGTETFAIPSMAVEDSIVVEAIDDNGNRSRLEKTYRHLQLEAETHRRETTLTVDNPAVSAASGGVITLNVQSDASFANAPFSLLATDDIHDPVNQSSLSIGIYELPTLNTLLTGNLDASGEAVIPLVIPPGSPLIPDLRLMVAIEKQPNLAKTNLVAIQVH